MAKGTVKEPLGVKKRARALQALEDHKAQESVAAKIFGGTDPAKIHIPEAVMDKAISAAADYQSQYISFGFDMASKPGVPLPKPMPNPPAWFAFRNRPIRMALMDPVHLYRVGPDTAPHLEPIEAINWNIDGPAAPGFERAFPGRMRLPSAYLRDPKVLDLIVQSVGEMVNSATRRFRDFRELSIFFSRNHIRGYRGMSQHCPCALWMEMQFPDFAFQLRPHQGIVSPVDRAALGHIQGTFRPADALGTFMRAFDHGYFPALEIPS